MYLKCTILYPLFRLDFAWFTIIEWKRIKKKHFHLVHFLYHNMKSTISKQVHVSMFIQLNDCWEWKSNASAACIQYWIQNKTFFSIGCFPKCMLSGIWFGFPSIGSSFNSNRLEICLASHQKIANDILPSMFHSLLGQQDIYKTNQKLRLPVVGRIE